jgi:hypothetical protein
LLVNRFTGIDGQMMSKTPPAPPPLPIPNGKLLKGAVVLVEDGRHRVRRMPIGK